MVVYLRHLRSGNLAINKHCNDESCCNQAARHKPIEAPIHKAHHSSSASTAPAVRRLTVERGQPSNVVCNDLLVMVDNLFKISAANEDRTCMHPRFELLASHEKHFL